MFRKKADDEDELGNLKARLAVEESLNKSLVERVAVLENVVEGHGKKIKENDELWEGYSDDMKYLRGERVSFKHENDKEHSEFRSGIKNLEELKAPKKDGWGIREQLNVERKRREKIAREKGRGVSGLVELPPG